MPILRQLKWGQTGIIFCRQIGVVIEMALFIVDHLDLSYDPHNFLSEAWWRR